MKQKNTEELRNSLNGQTIWLLGNGPSMKELDLSILKGKNILCVNQFYLHPQFDELDVNYFLIAHPSAFKSKEEGGDSYLLDSAITKCKSTSTTFLFPEKYSLPYLEKFNPDITYSMWREGNHIEQVFPLDLKTNAPRWAQNVFATALMWGLYMGAKNICLLGFDNGGITLDPFEGHFYEPIGHEKNILKTMDKKNFERSMYLVIKQIEAIENYASIYNQHIWNCNELSQIPIFPFAPISMRLD